MQVLKIPGVSKKYLRLAAIYRRFAGYRTPHAGGFRFDVAALVECYKHESCGCRASKDNGYVYGKWCKDVSVAMWIEDIAMGSACKAEFYTELSSWWAIPALAHVPASPMFAYT